MVIINGEIHTMAGYFFACGYIKIDENKIKEVGDMKDYSGTEDGEEVIDAKGGFIMPGIIEAHCHVGIIEEKNGQPGDDCNEATNPATPEVRALDGVNPMDPEFHNAIAAGITSLMTGPGSSNVVGGSFVFLKTYGRNIDDMIVKSPAAMKAALGENPKVCYGDQNQYPSTRMGNAAVLRKQLFEAKQYKEKRVSGDISKDFSMEPWIPVLDKQIPLKIHVHRADDILTALRIAKEFQIQVTLDHCTEGHIITKEIKESGFPAIVGPSLTARSKIECENLDFKTPGILHKAGVLVAIMTDHPVSLIHYLPLCAGLAVKEGLPMEIGLEAITINPAKICGVSDQLGSIEVGKDADIAIFTESPLVLASKTLYTIINGKVVYTHGKGIDKEGESTL